MKKALAILADHPTLGEIDAHFRRQHDQIDTRRKFLKKQADDLDDELNRRIDEINVEIANYLRGKGILPVDYDLESHHFHLADGAIIVCDEKSEGGSGFTAFIERILQ